PRIGLGPGAPEPAVGTTVSQRTGADPGFGAYHLFGPPPATDNDLLPLARALDEIERQVTHTRLNRPNLPSPRPPPLKRREMRCWRCAPSSPRPSSDRKGSSAAW